MRIQKRIVRFAKVYTIFTSVIGNSFIFFVVINLISYLPLKLLEPPSLTKQIKNTWGNCFPTQDAQDLSLLLKETWGRPYRYEPFIDHMERSFKGTFVNVSDGGFRFVENQATWPPSKESINLFVFGGSTTFGYGVRDNQTIPSYLQQTLRNKFKKEVNVYNFGAGHFYSTQELILFERLVSKLDSHSIDLAIFIDGLNDFGNLEDQSPVGMELKKVIDGRVKYSVNMLLNQLPLVQLFSYLKTSPISHFLPDESETARMLLKRFKKNKYIIEHLADGFGIKTFFVWQPVPWYPTSTPVIQSLMGDFRYTKPGYELAYKAYQKGEFGSNFLWLAGQTTQSQCQSYVDSIHYSPYLTQILANKIAENIMPSLNALPRKAN